MSKHGDVVDRRQCPRCKDSGEDNLICYENGYMQCFACSYYSYSNGQVKKIGKSKTMKFNKITNTQCIDLKSRKINKDICEHYNYTVGSFADKPVQIANYKNSQKLRFPDKTFSWNGSAPVEFFGQHLYNGGKTLVITEGELDCLSVSQVLGKQWAVVSLPNGTKSANRTFKENIEFLRKFESIVLFFDNDEAGREALESVTGDFHYLNLKVASYPEGFKDANELLVAGRNDDIKRAYFNAKEYQHEWLVDYNDLEYDDIMTEPVIGYELPYVELSHRMQGLRKAELTIVTAGSGIGKSTVCREITYHLATHHNLKIANVFLEESYNKTAQGYIAIDNNVPLGNLRKNPSIISREQFEASKAKIFKNMTGMNHFGSIDCKKLINRLEYYAVTMGVDFIILDHISIVVSGLESDNERKDIDTLMTALRSFIERTGVGIIAVVHLKRPNHGESYNEGREVSLSDLRGSAALEQLTDNAIACERNQQDEMLKHYVQFRILKCREFGDATGVAGCAQYHSTTGRMLHAEMPQVQNHQNNQRHPRRVPYTNPDVYKQSQMNF